MSGNILWKFLLTSTIIFWCVMSITPLQDRPFEDYIVAQVTAEEADQGGVIYNVLEGKKQVADSSEDMSELDMMIHLFQPQPEDTGYFIYLIPGPSGDPYDLVPLIDYKQTQKNGQDYMVKFDKFRFVCIERFLKRYVTKYDDLQENHLNMFGLVKFFMKEEKGFLAKCIITSIRGKRIVQ